VIATYRLQFNAAFTPEDARKLIPYLRDLGISDCYASPIFAARKDSSHGYDVCSFERINPSLGGEAAFAKFARKARRAGMGVLLDIVPNHMAADLANDWWRDVLEKGRQSKYAAWFDIDWNPPDPELKDKVLLPVLEDECQKVIGSGKIRLVLHKNKFGVAYYDRTFPLSPASRRNLKQEASRYGNAKVLRKYNDHQDAAGRTAVEQLLERQNYKLAFWRLASEKLNYRRFFDFTDFVCLRMEDPDVFKAAHALVFSLIKAGNVTGLRVDHPDGLWNPKQYFERLQALAKGVARHPRAGLPRAITSTNWRSAAVSAAACTGISSDPEHPQRFAQSKLAAAGTAALHQGLYVVAEKILTGNEHLPQDWPVHGTTGYDFLNHLNGLFVDPRSEKRFDSLYAKFTGLSGNFAHAFRIGKRKVLTTSLKGELTRLAYQLKGLTGSHNFSLEDIRAAIREIIVHFPVYRAYITERSPKPAKAEENYINHAIGETLATCTEINSQILRLLRSVLLLKHPGARTVRLRHFVMRFQQLTGPVTAKGLEDTAFYNYNRLISLNEVGGDPGTFGTSVTKFHEHNARIARNWPHTLLATATHDTKRGEDARARINVLSEFPSEWGEALERWSNLNVDKKTNVDGEPAPSANDEYLFYQTLIGAWPAAEKYSVSSVHRFRKELTQRVLAYMMKAVKEAKSHTSWLDPNEEYEKALEKFVATTLDEKSSKKFLNDFESFQKTIAFFGYFNSLSQLALKMTSPGVPDLYQGCELWDFSLVDPDNRRPVDFDLRKEILQQVQSVAAKGRNGIRKLLAQPETGTVKMYLLWRALELRNSHEQLFEQGQYIPLEATGEHAAHVIAFAREYKGRCVVTVAPRLIAALCKKRKTPPLGEAVWSNTTVRLHSRAARFRNVLSGDLISASKSELQISDILRSFPVGILTTEQ
jgi:(1->4)-alpha-D-glucan 1-alpha-D-glucosylmutase